jgi:hypothetical protein
VTEVKSRPELFQEERPDISDQDAVEATKKDRVVVSFGAHPVLVQEGKIAAMAIKWKLRDGSTETVLIDRYSADILLLLFARLEENDWKGAILVPPDAAVPL